jgi:hypothetical protein
MTVGQVMREFSISERWAFAAAVEKRLSRAFARAQRMVTRRRRHS